MSIITLKRNSQARHLRNHSSGPRGFSVWSTTNSGIYNGSRIISGFSSVQTPHRGPTPVGLAYVDKQGRRSDVYNKNIIYNCPHPSNVCVKNNSTVLNTRGLLNRNLQGTRHGKLNSVKQFANNNIQSEYINSQKNNARICNIEQHTDPDNITNCKVTSIMIGNGRRILVGNFVKNGALAKQSLNYDDYNNGQLMVNNCINHPDDNNPNESPNPLIRLNNGDLVSSNMKNRSSCTTLCA